MLIDRVAAFVRAVPLPAVLILLQACSGPAHSVATKDDAAFQFEDTRALVALVNDASERVRTKGETAFSDFRVVGSRWRQGESYIFVLDPNGNMLVHPDPSLEGKNQLHLKDIKGNASFSESLGPPRRFPTNRRAGTTMNGLFRADCFHVGKAPMSGPWRRHPVIATWWGVARTTIEWNGTLSWMW